MGFHYDGSWAEFVSVPYFAMTPLPEGIPFEQAAILADAMGRILYGFVSHEVTTTYLGSTSGLRLRHVHQC